MRFSNSFLDEIRDRVHISDVIGRRVSWDKKKTNTSRGDYWACCPFHGEKSPSFHCEDRKGRYHCFGCGVSGDHFRFLTELEGLSFPEAVQQIADMAGISMPQPDPQAEKRERERTSLQDVMEMATLFFQDQAQTALGARARAYLRDRGLTGRTIETFRLGYAPDSRNALKEHLASKGVSKEQMEACGLVVHENVPVSYDRFRDRIMFPILSSREKVIAFGGRAMASDAVAKYLNSNETEALSQGQCSLQFCPRPACVAGGRRFCHCRRRLYGRHRALSGGCRKCRRAARHGADGKPGSISSGKCRRSRSSALMVTVPAFAPPTVPPISLCRISSRIGRSALRCCPMARIRTISCGWRGARRLTGYCPKPSRLRR